MSTCLDVCSLFVLAYLAGEFLFEIIQPTKERVFLLAAKTYGDMMGVAAHAVTFHVYQVLVCGVSGSVCERKKNDI